MSVPKPAVALDGHCSAIYDDTLYVLSSGGLQSLPLQQNATWSQQPSGVSVTGAACAKVIPDGDPSGAALWVVGGVAQDSTFAGLQRFFFGNKTWETISPRADVLQGRTEHSVAYLNDSQSMLVYAGSQPFAPSEYSSQTFVFSTNYPFILNSYTSNAPPLTRPLISTWNSSHAVMVGGSASNTDVWTFGAADGWQQYATSLTSPLDSAVRSLLVDGTDGSKVLQLYDVTASPNRVTNVVLQQPDGQPGTTGQTVGNSAASMRRRDLTLDNWPSYDSTNAPTATRTDCSVARDSSSGLIALAGGNSDVPLALFDSSANSWVDAGKFFNANNQVPLQPSSTASSSPSATNTMPAATSSSAPTSGTDDGSAHARTLKNLGIALGVICGVAVFFVLLLLWLRWRKTQAAKRAQTQEKAAENRLSFADRGAPFMKEAGVATAELPPPGPNRFRPGHDSTSSLAIISNKFNPKRNTVGHKQKDSFESTARLVKPRGDTSHGEPVEMMPMNEKSGASSHLAVPGSGLDSATKAERKRSSGWSRYFATSQPADSNGLSHIPSVYIKPEEYTVNTAQAEQGRVTSQLAHIPSSTLMAPLDIDFSKTVDGQRLSHVASGSPSFADSREDLARDAELGRKASIVNQHRKSHGTSISSYGDRSTLSSTLTSEWYNTSAQSTWSPGTSVKDHRPTSSLYANSIYDIKDRPRPSRGTGPGFFPGTGTAYSPSSKAKRAHSLSVSSHATVTAARADAPLPPPPIAKAEERASTYTVFPSILPPSAAAEAAKPESTQRNSTTGWINRDKLAEIEAQEQPVNTDMSWIDLDLNKGAHST